MSLQDRVWLGVLLGLISCNGLMGERDSSVPWGRPDNGAGMYSRTGLGIHTLWDRRAPIEQKTSEVSKTSDVSDHPSGAGRPSDLTLLAIPLSRLRVIP